MKLPHWGLASLLLGILASVLLLVLLWSDSPERNGSVGEESSGSPSAEGEAVQVEREEESRPRSGDQTDQEQISRPSSSESVEARIDAMWAKRDCLSDSECRQDPADDPRQAHFELGQSMAQDMRWLIDQQQSQRLSDRELGSIAREMMGVQNDHAREAALEAMAVLPPESDNLDSMTTALDQHHNPRLIKQVMPEFKRHLEAGHGDRVHAFIRSNLETGSVQVSRTLAESLPSLLEKDRLGEYEETLERMPPGSRQRQLLKESLSSYR